MPEYLSYINYPLWQLKEWKEKAARVGDWQFALILKQTIDYKEGAEQIIVPDQTNRFCETCGRNLSISNGYCEVCWPCLSDSDSEFRH